MLTVERVRAVLADCTLFNDDDFRALTASANADPEEGAEWLPYYKLALAVLMQAFRTLDKLAGFSPKSPIELRVLSMGRELAKLSNRPCGIGPDESPERAAEVDRLNEDFLR